MTGLAPERHSQLIVCLAKASGIALTPTNTTFTWDIASGLPVVIDDEDAPYVYGATGLLAQATASETYDYLADGLGSTMATVDSDGDDGTPTIDIQRVGGGGNIKLKFKK